MISSISTTPKLRSWLRGTSPVGCHPPGGTLSDVGLAAELRKVHHLEQMREPKLPTEGYSPYRYLPNQIAWDTADVTDTVRNDPQTKNEHGGIEDGQTYPVWPDLKDWHLKRCPNGAGTKLF